MKFNDYSEHDWRNDIGKYCVGCGVKWGWPHVNCSEIRGGRIPRYEPRGDDHDPGDEDRG